MFKYEMKKIFSRMSGRLSVMLLLAVTVITCWFAADVSYVNEDGESETGYTAVRKLREAQKEWAGILDEEKLRQVIVENKRISMTPQAHSKDYRENDIAFGWRQGIDEIRDLLNDSYAETFRSYDYYRADSLSAKDAASFYENRTALLTAWLKEEAKDQFSDAEKAYLIHQYQTLEVPFFYDYMKGWTQLSEYAPTVIMVTMLILGFLTSGIFSNEYAWKADAVFFSAKYGRNRAVAAKVKAGFCTVTLLYWSVISLYSGAVLSYLGADGAFCPVQADTSGWKCFYNIQNWQKYLLVIAGGYAGCLFISLLAMLVSARTRSAVLAVMIPFVLIFVPSFLSNIQSPVMNKILGLLPDRLLQISRALGFFDLYQIGDRVTGAVPVLFVMYIGLAVILGPVIYQVYRRGQIR